MQFQYWFNIAINVCSRKSATTFGDLPNCFSEFSWEVAKEVMHYIFEASLSL